MQISQEKNNKCFPSCLCIRKDLVPQNKVVRFPAFFQSVGTKYNIFYYEVLIKQDKVETLV